MSKLPLLPEAKSDLPEIVKCLARHGPVYALIGLFIFRLPRILAACGGLSGIAMLIKRFG